MADRAPQRASGAPAAALAAHPGRTVRAAQMDPALPWVPVAVIGAGACGLTAALRLHDLGVDCVLLERDAQPGGSTALSSGFVPAAGTRVQRQAGVEDSPQAFAADIQAKARGTAAAELVQAYTEAIAPAIDALQQQHAVGFELLDGFLYPGHAVRRMHTLPQRSGQALMAALLGAAAAAELPVLTSATVRELWCDAHDRVLGVGFERPGGAVERLRCDQLILACNGFGARRDLVRHWLPAMADATYAGHAGNDGSALAWGLALGADAADLGAFQGHGSWITPQGALMTWAVMMEGGIQLNARGERFHDETLGYSEAAAQVLAQPGGVAWNLIDAPLLALAREFPDFREAEGAGACHVAADTAAVAARLGCPTEAVGATLAGVAPGAGDRFGRHFRRRLTPPFRLVKVTGALFHTQGGLAIDTAARVLRPDGAPLPNLLAAGGAARGVSGQSDFGYLSGNGLLSAIAGGWIAAGTAARAAIAAGWAAD
jgi:fumarate reductase flavoprotein subunit